MGDDLDDVAPELPDDEHRGIHARFDEDDIISPRPDRRDGLVESVDNTHRAKIGAKARSARRKTWRGGVRLPITGTSAGVVPLASDGREGGVVPVAYRAWTSPARRDPPVGWEALRRPPR